MHKTMKECKEVV